ncbi:hypothetical protein [uncultured Sphingomonas sp.]|uniref:hypothetical protein n=1 Tax=uncultured Sphingomonas sp. TaxID=158754 RepID=UPI002629ACE4|nr:hypothetical protein [uncultured Sphingomonas sp.]
MHTAQLAQPDNPPLSVFISGSISIRQPLSTLVMDRLAGIVERSMPILIGDAPGVDAAVQSYLARQRYNHVTIFCGGGLPRHNIGGWPVRTVRADAPARTRAWHMAKDREMARLADTGFVIWDGSSRGSFANIERLCRRGCYVLIYLDREQRFVSLECDAVREVFLASHRPG